mmetsp:Transcript_1843/g.2295  ORF Transcript_1843/g.2295 Transcript_1843/m.2295 type:complete len:124 (-) Transcript_1843:37-408(-)
MGTENENNNWPFIVMLIGRFVFGLGGDILSVCQSTMVSRWFMGKELSLALGIVLSLSWFGNIVCNYTIPPIAEFSSLGIALGVGFCTCIFSLTMATILVIFDKYINKKDKLQGTQEEIAEKVN